MVTLADRIGKRLSVARIALLASELAVELEEPVRELHDALVKLVAAGEVVATAAGGVTRYHARGGRPPSLVPGGFGEFSEEERSYICAGLEATRTGACYGTG